MANSHRQQSVFIGVNAQNPVQLPSLHTNGYQGAASKVRKQLSGHCLQNVSPGKGGSEEKTDGCE
jgi:hypothetical protein